jgi:hypothetical protein
VLRETTRRGLCGLVCPSRTSERGREGDCVKEGGGGEGDRERERALGLLLCHIHIERVLKGHGTGPYKTKQKRKPPRLTIL